MISWDNMKTMARATGRVDRQTRTFYIVAVEVGGSARRATLRGQVGDDGTIVADVKGPNLVCKSVAVPPYGAAPLGR
jgi:hypothetical protein